MTRPTAHNPPRRRGLGCLVRLLILTVGAWACYWLLFSPIQRGGPATGGGPLIEGEITEAQHAAYDRLAQQSAEPPRVLVQDGAVRFLTGQVVISDTIAISAQEKAAYFLKQNSDLFQLGDAAKNLRLSGKTNDDHGNTFVRYSQQYKGVPVYGSDLIVVVTDQDAIESVNAGYIPALEVDIQPSIRSLEAEAITLAELGADDTRLAEETRLMIFDPRVWGESAADSRLAWQITALSASQPGLWTFIVDAHSGDVLARFNALVEIGGTPQREVWEANNHDLGWVIHFSWLPFDGIEKVMDSNGAIKGKQPDEDATNAWRDAGRVYEYFWSKFHRDSYDNKGALLKIYVNVHLGDADHCRAARVGAPTNAMFYCDGWAGSADVFAHEFTHAVIEHTANFVKASQPAALNESYSDIFAVFLDDADPWRITGDAAGRLVRRDIANPGEGYPLSFDKLIPPAATKCPTIGDDLPCPHTNSIITSRAAYLATQGNAAQGITGVQRDTLQYIYYYTLTRRLGSATTFEQAARATYAECRSRVDKAPNADYPITIGAADCDAIRYGFESVDLPVDQTSPPPLPGPGGSWDVIWQVLAQILSQMQEAGRNWVDQIIGNLRQRIESEMARLQKELEDLIRHGIENALRALFQALIDALTQAFRQVCGLVWLPAGTPVVVAVFLRRRRR